MSLNKIKKETIIKSKLLKWYRRNARQLPWRIIKRNKLPEPYFVLISEFMLQQTTVNTVVSRFDEFIKIWPTLKDLSNTSESKILKFWSGLGYYLRAKNLLKSAKFIAKNYNYKIPVDYSDLIKLPGIGDYTAKAILGIAFNKPVMPIDANIERIVARLNGLQSPIRDIKYNINKYSNKLISKKSSSNFIQSLMDYGSIICLPNNPKCENCIIKDNCIAFKKNLTKVIPLKKINISTKPKKITRAYIIKNEFNEILVRRRPPTGMLQSMIEVPNDKWVSQKKHLLRDNVFKKISKRFFKIKVNLIYSFSHFNLEVEIYFTKIKKLKFNNHHWMSLKKINVSGMPTVMKKIVKLYISLVNG